MGGAWVFPGGAVDAADGDDDDAHRLAGVREVAEEAGVTLTDPGALVRFSRWITPGAGDDPVRHALLPRRSPRRRRPAGRRQRDASTSAGSRRTGAIEAHERGEIMLVFPTIKTLEQLGAFGSAELDPRVGPRPGPWSPCSRRSSRRARPPASFCQENRGGYEKALIVAVTGPTGDIGRALLRELDADPLIYARPRDGAPASSTPPRWGWEKTEYRQGDVLDRESVEGLVEEADVLVHLAFIILGGREETRAINLEGSRNVFEAAGGLKRLVYTSSVAAYGFHPDNPQPLTEKVPVRGTDAHYYSAQKAELEAHAAGRRWPGPAVETYVLRPCIVAGGDALALVEAFPGLLRKSPVGSCSPDPGTEFQLVHTDDVARAIAAAARGKGEPAAYNLAGDGTITAGDLARAFGWQTVPMPKLGVDVAATAVGALPFMPAQASWLNAFRVPVVMDTTRAREQLGWKPEYDTREVLEDTAARAREQGLI